MALKLPRRPLLDPVKLGLSTAYIESLGRHVLSNNREFKGWRVTPYIRDVIKSVLNSSGVNQNSNVPDNPHDDPTFTSVAQLVVDKIAKDLRSGGSNS
jgi:hypothetical protein